MNKFANGYAEAYVILNNLVEEDYDKIPPKVIQAIEENRNKDYIFELYDDIDLKDQILLPETKAILFNLFRDYLATPEQKEKIIRMQNEERRKLEVEKQKEYSVDIFQKQQNENQTIDEALRETVDLVEYKEPFLKKVWNYIKSLFNMNK